MAKSVYTRDYRVFLKQLRAAREASGLTQREVADRLGRSQSFVAKCEQGHNRVDVAQLVEFCRALGVPLVRFMEDYAAALALGAVDTGK